MSRVVEKSGAQVLPPADDRSRTVPTIQAHYAADADLRARFRVWRELAEELLVVGGDPS